MKMSVVFGILIWNWGKTFGVMRLVPLGGYSVPVCPVVSPDKSNQ